MIEIEIKTWLPGLYGVKRCVRSPRRILAAGAQAVVVALRKHFLTRESEPNALGWPKAHFWKREGADNTAVDTATLTDEHVTVRVASRAIAFKLKGGTIRPGPGRRNLAIPLTPKAKRAGSPRLGVIPNMFLLKRTGGPIPRLFLATADKRKGYQLQYLLVPSVTQRADARTLPSEYVLRGAALTAAEDAVARELRRTEGATA